MKTKYYLIIMALMVFPYGLYSQSSSETDGFLHVGDSMLNKEFNLTNYGKETARISDFKGKAVILDLWGVNCKGCIATMPKIQKLQQEFSDALQILMVTKDSREKVGKLAKKVSKVRENTLPFVMGEDSIAHLFDYFAVPSYVWIDQQGIIRYITSSRAINSNNVRQFIDGYDLAFAEKKDISFNPENPLMREMYPYFGDNFLMYTYLSPTESGPFHYGKDIFRHEENGALEKLGGLNLTIYELYKIAYNRRYIPSSRFVIDMENWEEFEHNYQSLKNLYNYELLLKKPIPETTVLKFMQAQVDMFFGIESSLKKTEVGCLVLKRIPGAKLEIATSGGKLGSEKTGNILSLTNMRWHRFTHTLEYWAYLSDISLLDETGIDQSLSIDISTYLDYNDLKEMNSSLRKYGLIIQEDTRELEVIHLKTPHRG